MICLIKDRLSFATKPECGGVVIRAEIVIGSIYDEMSKITIVRGADLPTEGDYVWLDGGYIGIIKSFDIEDEFKVDITCRQIITLFEREQFLTGRLTAQTVEARIKKLIEDEYINQSDPLYRFGFIQIRTEGETEMDVQPTLEDGFFSVKSYLLKARRLANVGIYFAVKRDTLSIKVRPASSQREVIVLPGMSCELLESRISDNCVSKVTVYKGDLGTKQDFYLLKTGNIATSPTAVGRIHGKWVHGQVGEDDDPQLEALDIFSKNSYSHNITFRSAKRMEWGTDLSILLNGRLYKGYVASAKFDTEEALYTYQSGDIDLNYPLRRRL